MKHSILTILLAIPFFVNAQQTTITLDFDGLSREYIKYVPSSYTGNEPVPIVFAFHGLGDTNDNFYNIGMSYIADTANFIFIVPQAILDPLTQSTAWNSGAGTFGIFPNADVDDIGLVEDILDTLIANYNIDQERIYACGFSMGGFFTNRIACELSDKFAATASVAGTIGNGITCNPSNKIRVCHFHGTADTQVGYGLDGGGVQDNLFGLSANEWFSFWQNYNECSGTPIGGMFPDIANDGYTVEYTELSGCGDDTEVVHYKVNGADHVWLLPNEDIFYTMEIWKFFNGWGPTNLEPISPEGVKESRADRLVTVFPDPTTELLTINGLKGTLKTIAVVNSMGAVVMDATHKTLDVSGLESGVYLLQIKMEDRMVLKRFIKR